MGKGERKKQVFTGRLPSQPRGANGSRGAWALATQRVVPGPATSASPEAGTAESPSPPPDSAPPHDSPLTPVPTRRGEAAPRPRLCHVTVSRAGRRHERLLTTRWAGSTRDNSRAPTSKASHPPCWAAPPLAAVGTGIVSGGSLPTPKGMHRSQREETEPAESYFQLLISSCWWAGPGWRLKERVSSWATELGFIPTGPPPGRRRWVSFSGSASLSAQWDNGDWTSRPSRPWPL